MPSKTNENDTTIQTLVDQGLITDPTSAKGKLLLQAATLFKEKGYERTTVRDLANAVGIQSGSIFHHFKTKEDILKAVMEETIIYNTQRMRQKLAEAKTPREEVLALITCELESVIGGTGDAMAVLVYEWRSLKEDNQLFILKMRDEYEQLWLNVLDKAKEAGEVVGDTFILRRFLTGALGWTTNWYKPDGNVSIAQLAEEALLLAVKS